MEIKAATIAHWPLLQAFYQGVYKAGHPLQNIAFWQWQFGNPAYGKAFIAIENGEIAGHLGVSLSGGYAWHICLYVLPQYRNGTVLLSLINAAGHLGKQGNINANADAIKLYRLLGWYQYTSLIRMTCINPAMQHKNIDELITPITLPGNTGEKPEGHYWQQPTLQGCVLADGSLGVLQPLVGAVRFAILCNPKKALQQAWDMGFNWADYITSFNNPLLLKLEKAGWQTDTESNIPWRLNPVIKNSASNISFLTKEPIPIDFYINRTHSDIGRVGSIPPI